MSGYTKGPWTLVEGKHGNWEIMSADGKAFMGETSYYPWQSDNIEDARLIAAAPELLEALELAEELYKVGIMNAEDGLLEAVVAKRRAAIKKAKGE